MDTRKFVTLAVCGIALVLVGCGNEEPKETPALKEAMSGKQDFDMNKVPEKDQEMVRQMTQGRGGASTPGSGK